MRNQHQAEAQIFLWLEGSDLSWKNGSYQALESQSPDCGYPNSRNGRSLDGMKMTWTSISWEVGTLA